MGGLQKSKVKSIIRKKQTQLKNIGLKTVFRKNFQFHIPLDIEATSLSSRSTTSSLISYIILPLFSFSLLGFFFRLCFGVSNSSFSLYIKSQPCWLLHSFKLISKFKYIPSSKFFDLANCLQLIRVSS